MREIKFRAWVGAMLLPEQANIGFMKDRIVVEPTSQEWINTYGHDWKLESVMQYTGLKDKNGTEIYEGDIVRFPKKIKEGYRIAPVAFWHGHFMLTRTTNNKKWVSMGQARLKDNMEVVGNIYENGDLLK